VTIIKIKKKLDRSEGGTIFYQDSPNLTICRQVITLFEHAIIFMLMISILNIDIVYIECYM